MVEVHNNRARFFDGGCEVQSNFIIKNWINQGVILEDQVVKEGFFFKVAAIFFREWFIGNCVVRGAFTTIGGWLKLAPKTLIYKGCGVNISGCRGMAVLTKSNSCYRGFWFGVYM